MPGYKRSEVANSDKKWKKLCLKVFIVGAKKRKRHNPAQILKMKSELLDLYSAVGFVFHCWMSGAKRSPKHLMMIVRVPKRQKLS